ncbi:MAG: flippase-like domain-containing protein [Polyangiaceae bacterium]|nr:flippase-like domain-containing protein [Polyangiaceae bacterium]
MHDDASRADPALPPAKPRASGPLWRRLLPIAVAVGLVAFVLARIKWEAFWAELGRVHYAAFLGFVALFLCALLAADTLATRFIYRRTIGKVRYHELFLVRGASYLPSMLNHHVGQAWLTYFLSRVYGAPLGRVAGATLAVYATWGGCMLLLGAAGMYTAGLDIKLVLLPLVAGVGYLVLLQLRPKRLTRISVLAPLFELGIGGHFVAMLLRLPHMCVLFLGTWLPFWFFHVEVPLGPALTYVPILMVAVTLPVTPLGIGTRDALAQQFFAGFVVGAAGSEEQLAIVAASTTTTAVAIILVNAVMGVVLLAGASRLLPAELRKAGAAKAEPR